MTTTAGAENQQPHYEMAEQALDRAGEYDLTTCGDREIATAQVHATLALRDEVRRVADALAARESEAGR